MERDELEARIERAGNDELRAILTEVANHLATKAPPPPDFDAQERDELSRVRHGDWRSVSQIQQKYQQLRDPRPGPAVRVDKEIEQAKQAGTLEELYTARMAKVRHGDVSSIVELKAQFRGAGLEVY